MLGKLLSVRIIWAILLLFPLLSPSGDEVSKHRITRLAVVHEKMPAGYTEVEVFFHVVVNTSGQVESTTALHMNKPEQWEKDQAEAAEKLQRFRPFRRWGIAVRAAFEDVVWIVPPVEWVPHPVPFSAIQNWSTLRIRLSRTGCYGVCPSYSIEVRGDGEVLFEGEQYVAVGHHQSRISREAVDRLVAAFRDADYFSLKDEYVSMITDNPTCTSSIEFDGHRKSVKDSVGFTAGMPAVVEPLENKIDQIARDEK